MKTTVEHITPARALAYLEKNLKSNRTLSASTVKRYAAEMQHGHWMLTHQGIAFDDKGNLIDGQHRLHGVAKSGVTVDMLVTRDVPAEQTRNGITQSTFAAIDRLKLRNVGQVLQLSHGRAQGTRLASCANTILRIADRGALPASVPTALKVLDIYEPHILALLPLSNAAWPKQLRVAAILATLAFARFHQPKRVDAFAKMVFSGDGLEPGHPAKLLRKFATSKVKDTKQGAGFSLRMARATAAAYLAYADMRQLGRIPENDSALSALASDQPENVETLAALSTFRLEGDR